MTGFTVPQESLKEDEAPGHSRRVGLKLEVIAGSHRGAVLFLDKGDYRIGSSPAADIVLSDPDVTAVHAVLHIERRSVRIEAVGADMTVGQEPLPSLRGCRTGLPVTFSLGAAQICLSSPDQGDQGRGSRRPLVVAGALACAGLAMALAIREFRQATAFVDRTLAMSSPHDRPNSDGANVDSTFLLPTNSPTAEGGVLSRTSMQDAMNALKARIEAAHLETLQVGIEDGRLMTTGTLSGPNLAEWEAIQQWFDKAYGRDVVLASRIAPPSAPRAMPTLQLQAVWYGKNPYVVMGDGGHYFKGAVLDNGWIIREIGEDHLLLVKGEETVALTYQ